MPAEPEEFDGLAALERPAELFDLLRSPEALRETLDQELVAALDRLNPMERAVLLLRAIGDLRYREMSEVLEIPLGSVMGNLARARQKMRNAIVGSRRRSTK